MMNKIFEYYGSDPVQLLKNWLEEAEKTEINNYNAFVLATADVQGRPSSRPMLLKGIDERCLVFFTNYESGKGQDLQANPYAQSCFYWKSLSRQVRVSGAVKKTSEKESNEYFATRERGSKLGAWASKQSRHMEHYEALADTMRELEEKFAAVEDIPRPPHWGGYRILPQRMEFWLGGKNRLHERFVYTKDDNGEWQAQWLYP